MHHSAVLAKMRRNRAYNNRSTSSWRSSLMKIERNVYKAPSAVCAAEWKIQRDSTYWVIIMLARPETGLSCCVCRQHAMLHTFSWSYHLNTSLMGPSIAPVILCDLGLPLDSMWGGCELPLNAAPSGLRSNIQILELLKSPTICK